MKRKIALTALLLLLSVTLVLAACDPQETTDHTHNMICHPYEEGNCFADGNEEYYECADCGKFFADQEGTKEIAEGSWVIEGTHVNLKLIPYQEATCGSEGNVEYYICMDCGRCFADSQAQQELFDGEWIIPAKSSHSPVFVEGVSADCFNYGNISYYFCEICGNYFSDVDCQNRIEYQDTVIQPLNHVNKYYHERQDATCYEDGNVAYYECPDCGLFFDEEGDEISEGSWIIFTNGHQPGEEFVKSEVPATCTEYGYREIVVMCEVCGKIAESFSVEVPPTGHTFEAAWQHDDVSHWHNATCGHDARGDEAVHDFENNTCKNCAFHPDYTAGLEYALNEDSTAYVVVGAGQGSGDTLIIPEVYNGLPVVGIGESAFNGVKFFTSVTIPQSVTEIDRYAFYDTALTSVTIPQSVSYLGGYAFSHCKDLKSVTVSHEIESFGYYIFESSAIAEAQIHASVAECLPKTIKRVTVTGGDGISDDAFRDSDVQSVTLPEGLTYVGNFAFCGCTALTDVVLPASVQSIGEGAFSGCTALTNVSLAQVQSIDVFAFSGCTALTELDLSSLDWLGTEAFINCSGITTITTSVELDTIPEGAFSGCVNLESFDFLEGVRYIGARAFAGCAKLSAINLGSIRNIGSRAFENCTGLHTVSIGYTNQFEQADKDAFQGCVNITKLFVTSLYSFAASLIEAIPKNSLQSVTIDGSIPAYAFSGCTTLTEFIGGGSIGDGAFEGCTSLSVIEGYFNGISNKAHFSDIGDRAFANCTSLTRWEASISGSIGTEAFSGCSALEYFDMGTADSIGLNAFEGCDSLSEVEAGAYTAEGNSYAARWVQIEGLENLMNRDVTLLFGGEPVSGHVEIPNFEFITSIPDYAFYGQPITSVTIADNVQSVGSHAFEGTQITSASLPVGLINYLNGEFYQKIVSLEITGSGELNVYNGRFGNLTALTSVTVGSGISRIASSDAFLYATSLSEVHISDLEAWCSIVFDNKYSNPLVHAHNLYLNGEKITDLVVPDGVGEIKSWTFAGGRFNSVTLHDSVTLVNYAAFAEAEMTSLILPFVGKQAGRTENLRYIFSEDANSTTNASVPQTLRHVTVTGNYALPVGAFAYCGNVQSIVLPDGVTLIPGGAFRDCASLTGLVIPDGVTEIGDSAFYGCTALSELAIPDGVQTIGDSAFYGCVALSEMAIPTGVQTIGERAFTECAFLSEIVIPDGVTAIGKEAFKNCTSLSAADIGDGVTEIPYWAFYGCSALKEITFGNSIAAISEYAFSRTDVSRINISDLAGWLGISVGGFSFGVHDLYLDGAKVVTLNVPQQVTSISAIVNGASFENVVIHDAVTSIAYGAFSRCENIQSATIPAFAASYLPKTLRTVKITSGDALPEEAFRGAVNLSEVTLCADLDIGDRAFEGCTSLTGIEFPSGDRAVEIGYIAFYNCTSLAEVSLPQNLAEIGEMAFCNTALTEVVVPSKVDYVGRGAFQNCNIHAITLPFVGEYSDGSGKTFLGHVFGAGETGQYKGIPSNLSTVVLTGGASIGMAAFENFENLSAITLPEELTSVGNAAFHNCYKLVEIFNNSSLELIPGSTDYGEVAYYAKNVYTQQGGSWITDTSDGYRFMYNKSEKKGYLLNYWGDQSHLTLPDQFNSHDGELISQYEIYPRAFMYGEMQSVTFSDSVTKVGNYAFQDCADLLQVIISDSVTALGYCSFEDCTALEQVEIGSGVREIDTTAFHSCGSLNVINVASANGTYHSDGNCLINTASKPLIVGTNQSVIPADGSVTEIGDSAFLNRHGLSAIVIPDSVIMVGRSAFDGCTSLQSVAMGSGLTEIGNDAFANCSALTAVTVPDNVQSIGSWAFEGCEALQSITLPFVGNGVISDENSYTKFSIIFGSVPESLRKVVITGGEEIADSAFEGCASITEIVLPDSVTSIGNRAFYNCSALTDIHIGNGVTSAGEWAFYGSNALQKTHISDFDAWFNVEFANSAANPLTYSHYMYVNGALLSDIVIPETVTEIKPYAFYGASIAGVTVHDGLQSVGRDAFRECAPLTNVYISDLTAWLSINFSNLASNPLREALYLNGDRVLDLVIPQSVTEVKFAAFASGDFNTVTIHDGVTYVGNDAFGGSTLQKITLPLQAAVEGDRSFSDLFTSVPNSLVEVVLSSGTDLPYGFFSTCANIKYVTLPDELQIIGGFGGCKSLVDIVIPDGVTTIRGSAFANCSSLTAIAIPDGVTTIGNSAFANCSSLTAIAIPAAVTSIGEWVFNGCASLETITVAQGNTVYRSESNCLIEDTKVLAGANQSVIPADVYRIGDFAFSGSNVTEIVIPKNITTIGSYAFSGCSELTTVTMENSDDGKGALHIDDNAFRNCTGLKEITFSNKGGQVYAGILYGCKALEKITLYKAQWLLFNQGDSKWVFYLGALFKDDFSTTSKGVVPASLKTVVMKGDFRADTFAGCDHLTSIVLENVTNIPENAFDGCISLTGIYYYGTAQQWSEVTVNGNATEGINVYFYSEQQPAEDGYWHYVDGLPVVW